MGYRVTLAVALLLLGVCIGEDLNNEAIESTPTAEPTPLHATPTVDPTPPPTTPTVDPTPLPTVWNSWTACPAQEIQAEHMDACTCKRFCKNYASWTSLSHMPNATVKQHPGSTENTVQWSTSMASAVSNASDGWVAKACDDVCQLTAEGSRVKRFGVEEENRADNTAPNNAYKRVVVMPLTLAADGSTTKIRLPASAFAMAKTAIFTREKELIGSYGFGAKFDVTMQSFKVLQCVTTIDRYEKCCSIPKHKTTADFEPYLYAKRYFEKNPEHGTFRGGNCGPNDGCWDSQKPPVTCGVKKSTIVFKVCMKAQKSESVAWENVTPKCWYPTGESSKLPKPFCLNTDSSTADCDAAAVDWRGLQTTDSWSDIFGGCCHDGTAATPCGTGETTVCSASPYASQTTWAEEDGLMF